MTDEKARAFAKAAMKATGGRGVEPIPTDLAMCRRCRKVIGPHGGWYGPECQCDKPPVTGPIVGHSAGPGGRNHN